MKVGLLLVIVLTLNAHQPTSKVANRTTTVDHKTTLTFIANVKSIEPLGKRKLPVIPVDLDPRFALTVHIESVTSPDGPLQADTEQVFAIHSPAQLFATGAEDVISKRYRFKVDYEKSDKARFSNLIASVMEDKGNVSNYLLATSCTSVINFS